MSHLLSTALNDSAAVLTTLKESGRNFSMAARIPSEPNSISERNFLPTLNKASRGQGWNQSNANRTERGSANDYGAGDAGFMLETASGIGASQRYFIAASDIL